MATISFSVRNPTNRERVVTASFPPMGFGVTPGTARLQPGERMPWAVHFHPADPRVHLGELTLSDDLGCEVRLSLRGIGQGEVATRALDFGFVPAGTEKALELPLFNTRREPVRLLGLELPAPFHLTEALPLEVPALGSLALHVKAAPVAPGRVTADAVLRTAVSTHLVSLTVQSTRPRALMPATLGAPRVAPGLFFERTLVVENTALPAADDTDVLFLEDAGFRALDGGALAGFTVRVQPSLAAGLRGGTSGEVLVRLDAPLATGLSAGVLQLFTNDPLQPRVDVELGANVEVLPTCALTVTPAAPLELVAQGDGGSRATVRFEADGGACVVDDVRLINVPGLRLVGEPALQQTAPFELEVTSPTPRSRSRLGAVQYHPLLPGERVHYIDVYASP